MQQRQMHTLSLPWNSLEGRTIDLVYEPIRPGETFFKPTSENAPVSVARHMPGTEERSLIDANPETKVQNSLLITTGEVS